MAETRRGLLGRLFGGEPARAPAPPDARAEKSEAAEPVTEAVVVPPPSTPASAIPPEPASSGGWWQRLRSGLSRSTQSLTTGIADVLTKRKLDAESLEDLEDLL